MDRRFYTIAFLLVLLAACGGAVFGGTVLWRFFQGDGLTSKTWTPPETDVPAAVEVTVPPVTVAPPAAVARATATRVSIPVPVAPTPAPLPTLTPTSRVSPTPVSSVIGVTTVTVTTTVVTATVTPLPGNYPYVLAGPVRHSNGDCPGNYILGQVTDQQGKPISDVRFLITDEYGNQEVKVSKSPGPDAGRYDFPLFGPPRRYYLMVIDATGRSLSPTVEISHGVGTAAQTSCHWTNWQAR